jgi:hypothetical protein
MIDGQESSGGGEPPRRGEGDFFSERRARRAVEAGETALLRRAEAAEATVHTLERHVASLQERLREAEEERRAAAELLEAEKDLARERERELRRIRQREYAEQQLRVEAEERVVGLDRAGAAELEQLDARLQRAERELRTLGERRESLHRELAEAEQAAAAERSVQRSSEEQLRERIAALERAGGEVKRALEAERSAREGFEAIVAHMRDGYRQLSTLLIELRTLVARLAAALARGQATRGRAGDGSPAAAAAPSTSPSPSPAAAASPSAAADRPSAAAAPPALAAATAFDRGRTGEESAGGEPPVPTSPLAAPTPPRTRGSVSPGREERAGADESHAAEQMADALAAAVERLRRRAEQAPASGVEAGAASRTAPPHKHSMSLIGRIRYRRKQRHAA